MESKINTDAVPTARDLLSEPQPRTENVTTLSKTQNMQEILRGINDCFSGDKSRGDLFSESAIQSLTTSIYQPMDDLKGKKAQKNSIMNMIEKQ